MILQRISIINYKNILEASVDFSPKINCLIGANGMGKTNLLDAIYYLSFCKDAHNPIDSQVINHNKDFFVLEGIYSNLNNDLESIYCGIKRGCKKHFKRNKKEYKKLSQHIGLIPLVMVSPADSLLIEGGSEERRRFMDMVISQYDRSYAEALIRYNKALQQRNALLKLENMPDLQLIGIWEEEMANTGQFIFTQRKTFVHGFISTFNNIYHSISNGNEKVVLRYVSHGERGNLLDVIQRDRNKDFAVGYSLHGVHRDDLEMLLDGFQIKREGSQGQNKTFVLALKLAQFYFLKHNMSASTPILLLDDIFDRLDSDRVENIIKLVSGDDYGQIFITDTNREHLDKILIHSKYSYKLFNVINGSIKELREDRCLDEM